MNEQNLNLIIKKLLYKSNHRGCKETDIILGLFAKEFIFQMNAEALRDFAKILEQNDVDIYNWCLGKIAVPLYLRSTTMRKLLNFSTNMFK